MVRWDKEDINMNCFSVSYNSLGQYKILLLDLMNLPTFFTTETGKMRKLRVTETTCGKTMKHDIISLHKQNTNYK